MSLLSRLFPGLPAPAAHPRQLDEPSRQHPQSQNATRRELVRVVLRDTLIKHGIPTGWIGGEMLVSGGNTASPELHLRLLVKHWDARLMPVTVALQHSLLKRITLFDPLAPTWLAGISWQYQLDDESNCPDMPDPALWTVQPMPKVVASTGFEDDQLTELRRVLAEGDAKHSPLLDGNGEGNFERTQPFNKTMPFRPTEPAQL